MSRHGLLLREFGFANLALAMVWFLSIGAGLVLLLNYANRPGPRHMQPGTWPENSLVSLPDDQPTVLMFVHPHCPCTRASVNELARVVANCQGMARFLVVAYQPTEAAIHWKDSDLIKSASGIPGTTVFWDTNGAHARQFQVSTSGHLLLYDCDGKLRFSGGITISRGHEGSSRGRQLVESWLQDRYQRRELPTELLEVPVFGCSLIDGSQELKP